MMPIAASIAHPTFSEMRQLEKPLKRLRIWMKNTHAAARNMHASVSHTIDRKKRVAYSPSSRHSSAPAAPRDDSAVATRVMTQGWGLPVGGRPRSRMAISRERLRTCVLLELEGVLALLLAWVSAREGGADVQVRWARRPKVSSTPEEAVAAGKRGWGGAGSALPLRTGGGF